jgi:hypothetical protein
MTTSRQLEANRANAQLSTGPRTGEGKTASSRNARSHGLCSRQLYIPAGERPAFDEMFESLHAEILPRGEIQAQLFERLIHASWNLRFARIKLAEAQAQDDETRVQRYHRYARQHARDYDHAYARLRHEQTERALRVLPRNEPILDLPTPVAASKILPIVQKIAKRDDGLRDLILLTLATELGPPPAPSPEADPAPFAA